MIKIPQEKSKRKECFTMEYRRFDDKIVAWIDRGEEILEQVKELARRENITLASVTALGATNDFTVSMRT